MILGEQIWDDILRCKELFDKRELQNISIQKDRIICNQDATYSNGQNLAAITGLSDYVSLLNSLESLDISPEVRFVILHYLIFMIISDSKSNKPVTIAHFAQTLDGKIATNVGHSQWIGNEENLLHAHRLRAVCDAVLIGGNTLKNDKPRLNVRKVKGKDPARVIISSKIENVDSLLDSSTAPIICFCNEIEKKYTSQQVEIIQNDKKSPMGIGEIMGHLYKKGIKSILIEGGSATTSSFITNNCVDIIQYHIAPMLFGSGIPNYSKEPIFDVQEALTFTRSYFHKMGDAMMFTGYVDGSTISLAY